MNENNWSVPQTDVLARAREAINEGSPAVLATIVAVEGSAYRRPGAKMLIEEDGAGVGTITAGCLEDEVQRLADEVLTTGEPVIKSYDLRPGEDDVWGLGVGCNGVIDILLEPLAGSIGAPIEAVADGDPVAIVTGLDGDIETGTRSYYRVGSDGLEGDLPDWVKSAVREPAEQLAARGKAETITVADGGREATVFVDGLKPPADFVVCGTGHDVGPMVELAKRNDFHVTVVSFRGGTDVADRFPLADETVTTSPSQLRESLSTDDSTYVVLSTHNFVDDRLALEELVGTDVPYLGLMGPRERFERMLEEFEAEGRTFDRDELANVYTPVGLDLGGGAPYQIATSVVAEVLAVHNGREPKHLKDREGSIHDRPDIVNDASL